VDQKWHVISSQTLLRDRWIDVRADDCITSGGVKISPCYVLTYPDCWCGRPPTASMCQNEVV
jgi:hypothetical protein